MASDFEAFQRELMARIAASYGMAFDQMTGVVGLPQTDSEWYRRIGAQLDDLPDDGGLWIARFKLAWHPGRYVWVDRHLRVWRSDDAGRLTTRQSLICREEN